MLFRSGISPIQWRNARNAYWSTTVLALGTFAGQVVSVTHPDVPGYRGTCNVSGTTVTRVSGDDWDDSLYRLPNDSWASAMLNHDALIGGVQVTITGVTIAGGSVTALTIGASGGTGGGGTGGGTSTPVIISISPVSAQVGSAAFTLTINGTGFLSGARITWDGRNKTTTFVRVKEIGRAHV